MTRLLHLSDPHFGTVQPPVAEALLRLAKTLRPDLLVLSGDITQRAKPAEFRAARVFCDRLGIPLRLALPGNHDIALLNPWRRLVAPYAAYLREFGPQLQPSLSLPGLCLIGVNTTRWWRHKNGEVSAAQIEQVSLRLRAADVGAVKIVVVHQPVHVLRAEDEHDRLRNAGPALRAWADAGADLVMGGHIHLPYVCELSEGLGLSRRLWCVQAGTALSSRVRREAPNSVNLLQLEAGPGAPRCKVERWDYRGDASGGEFALAQAHDLALDRTG